MDWMIPYGRRPTRADLEDSCRGISEEKLEAIIERLGPLVLPSRIGTIQIKKDLTGSRNIRDIPVVQQAQGYDDATEQTVFVKFERSDSRRTLQNEIEIFAHIREKNVGGIPRYITDKSNGAWDSLVLGFLEGHNLRQLKTQFTKTKDIVLLGLQVSKILAEIHSAGVVHGDVAPQNIFVASEHHLKVLQIRNPHYTIVDFGNSRRIGVEMDTGGGTSGFQSPEQLDAQSLDYRSDVFSFGVVLGWLLTGVDFANEVKFREAVQSSGCDPAVHSIISRSTLMKRDSRFNDMGAVHQEFVALRNRIEQKKHRRRAQLISCALGMLIAAVSVLAWKVRSLSEEKRRNDAKMRVVVNDTDALADLVGADLLIQHALKVRDAFDLGSEVSAADLDQLLPHESGERIRALLSADLLVPHILNRQAWKLNQSAATYLVESGYVKAANEFARAAEVADAPTTRSLNVQNATACYFAAGKPMLAISLLDRELDRTIANSFAEKANRFELLMLLSFICFHDEKIERAEQEFAEAEAVLQGLISSHDHRNAVDIEFAKAALLSLRFRFAYAEGDTQLSEQALSGMIEIRERVGHIKPGEPLFCRVLKIDREISFVYALLDKIRLLSAHVRRVVNAIREASKELPDDWVAIETARHQCYYVYAASNAQYKEGTTDAAELEIKECATSILKLHQCTSNTLRLEVACLLLYGAVLERHPGRSSELVDLVEACSNRCNQLRRSSDVSLVMTVSERDPGSFAILEVGASRISVIDQYLSVLPLLREAAIRSMLLQNAELSPKAREILTVGAGHDRFDSEKVAEIVICSVALREFANAQQLGEGLHRSVKLALQVAPNCAAHEIYGHMFNKLIQHLFVAGDEDRVKPGRHRSALGLWYAFFLSAQMSWKDADIRSDVRTKEGLLRSAVYSSANNFAWVAALYPNATEPQLNAALDFAEECCRFTNYADENLLETLAICQHKAGYIDEARKTWESIRSLRQIQMEKAK
ncbi:serine/threonine protein kinase [Stieleria neptunia]|nr:protein kinase [Stieleria neptunia]